jgi:hypothetical protein
VEPVEPSVLQGSFERLPQNDDFLVHGIPRRRLSVFLDRFLVAMNTELLNLGRA